MSRHDAIIDILTMGGACVAYLLLEAVQVPKRWSFLAMGLVLVVYAVKGEEHEHFWLPR